MLRVQPDNDPPNSPLPASNIEISMELARMALIKLESDPPSSPTALKSEYFSQSTESNNLGVKFTLHSPSAITGTPRDPSSRFEYPFPSPDVQGYAPSFFEVPVHTNSLLAISTPRGSKRPSMLHPRHTPREPPMPPSLARRYLQFDLHLPMRRSSLHDVVTKTRGKSPRRRDTDGEAHPRAA